MRFAKFPLNFAKISTKFQVHVLRKYATSNPTCWSPGRRLHASSVLETRLLLPFTSLVFAVLWSRSNFDRLRPIRPAPVPAKKIYKTI